MAEKPDFYIGNPSVFNWVYPIFGCAIVYLVYTSGAEYRVEISIGFFLVFVFTYFFYRFNKIAAVGGGNIEFKGTHTGRGMWRPIRLEKFIIAVSDILSIENSHRNVMRIKYRSDTGEDKVYQFAGNQTDLERLIEYCKKSNEKILIL